MITRSREFMMDGFPAPDLILSVLKEFLTGQERLEKLRKAYENERGIMKRIRPNGAPNNKIAHGFARYIVTMSSGYMLGKPVSYTDENQKAALDSLLDAYKLAKIDSVDAELAKDAAVYGRAVELLFSDENARPKSSAINPESAFVVYDDTVQNKPLFGVYFNEIRDVEGTKTGYALHVYSDAFYSEYRVPSLSTIPGNPVQTVPTFFGSVPMVEYWNGEDEQGDFEQVQSLIDAYDLLESDRVNDKEQFVNALLIITGARLETDEGGRTPAQQLRQDRLLFLPDAEAKAEYLAQSMNEADVEVLKNAIKADIHKFSMVPDLTDEQFAGNASGVAMRYKLLGLENLTRIKERWFREALQDRMRLYAHFLNVKGAPALDVDRVLVTFSRSLPENLLEISQMVSNLKNTVPDTLLLSQIPFVENVDAAILLLKAQQAEALKAQQAAFGVPQPMQEEEE